MKCSQCAQRFPGTDGFIVLPEDQKELCEDRLMVWHNMIDLDKLPTFAEIESFLKSGGVLEISGSKTGGAK